MRKSEPTPIGLPPRRDNAEGAVRRVGVEIELAGVDPDVMLRAIAAHFGGRIVERSSFAFAVEAAEHGDFLVELDADPVQALGDRIERGAESSNEPTQGVAPLALRTLASVAEVLVPWEIVTPPLPMDALPRLAPVIGELREAGARGTAHSARYAFGVHLNPEMPDLELDTLLAYMRAYLCLEDWLRQGEAINFARHLTPHIRAFPEAYAAIVLNPGYKPENTGALIDDYLEHNPTRNRGLDLLPLFAELDERRVRGRIDDPRIKARPALHYRLPNCEIDNPDWCIGAPWQRWLNVEYLAADTRTLTSACAHALAWRSERGVTEQPVAPDIDRYLLAPGPEHHPNG